MSNDYWLFIGFMIGILIGPILACLVICLFSKDIPK
jgi:hypothetical protein